MYHTDSMDLRDPPDFIDRFRASLKIPTWWPPGASEGDAGGEAILSEFQEFLVENYPAFHRIAERRVLSPFMVLYRWPGTENSPIAPVLFLAHYDVVAAETEKWSVDPFGAEIKEGFIYGRGSLDMKSTLISLLEGAENLLAEGFSPKRDIWFAFGGDEERTGFLGAKEAALWFAQRGQKFSWILDEGTPFGESQIAGVNSPLALISIEEKGFMSLNLRVDQEPGHASRPPETQAAAILARALCRIAARPFPFTLIPSMADFYKQVSRLIPGPRGFVMRHPRVMGPLFFSAAAVSPISTAMLRTTVAMTQLQGSGADNVLPSEVRAVINLRLLRPWTADTATAFIKKTVKDERVKISLYGRATNPIGARDDYQKYGWSEIKAALAQAWPGVPMVPSIMVAATDSRHYRDLAHSIYRFSPHKVSPEDLRGIHGHDERISLENLHKGLIFYTELMKSS